MSAQSTLIFVFHLEVSSLLLLPVKVPLFVKAEKALLPKGSTQRECTFRTSANN